MRDAPTLRTLVNCPKEEVASASGPLFWLIAPGTGGLAKRLRAGLCRRPVDTEAQGRSLPFWLSRTNRPIQCFLHAVGALLNKATLGFCANAALASLSFAATLNAFADVTLKNGNFYVSFTDLSYAGGFEPKIERVYNSKSSFKGLFGWGWGTEYEVYVTVEGDGTATVHEYGSGAENVFSPPSAQSA